MGELIDTTEMYLKTIYELNEDGIVPMRARIVERIGHSGPTVSQTIARMERDGLVIVGTDRKLNLTDEGAALATEVMRKHRLAERLLLDVIGLDWELVHDEACRWEHVMSDQVEDRLLSMLGVQKLTRTVTLCRGKATPRRTLFPWHNCESRMTRRSVAR